MVTYYIDATNAQNPQLIRQVNYPNYPAGAPVNPPTAIADDIENLAFSYAITSSTDPAGTYPTTPFTNGPGNAPQPILPDTPAQIRAVNVFLAGRSENTYTALRHAPISEKQSQHPGEHSQPFVHQPVQYVCARPGALGPRIARHHRNLSSSRRTAVRMEREKGVALITSLMVLLLISAIVVGMCWMVMTDQRLGGNNQSRELAFYGAEAGMEKMTTDVANVFATSGSLTAANVATITAAPPNLIPGVQYLNTAGGFHLQPHVRPRRIRQSRDKQRHHSAAQSLRRHARLDHAVHHDGGGAEHRDRSRSEADPASPGRRPFPSFSLAFIPIPISRSSTALSLVSAAAPTPMEICG